MASDQSRYVAEGFHRLPAVEELERVLDRYDRARKAAAAGDEDAEVLEARHQFRLDWAAAREDRLRAALEEVAWLLERRGHHAWIEPSTAPVEASDVVEARTGGRREHSGEHGGEHGGDPLEGLDHPPAVLVFSFLPSGADISPDMAAGVALVPDQERCRVDITGWFPGERSAPLPLARGLILDDLGEAQLVAIVTQQVAQVLLDAVPPLPEPAIPEVAPEPYEPEDPPVPPEQHQWSDTSLGARRRRALRRR